MSTNQNVWLHDSNNIFDSKMLSWDVIPNAICLTPRRWLIGTDLTYDAYCINKHLRNLIHSVKGTVTMKMLAIYADGKEHHWDEINPKIGIPKGNDIECWHSLIHRNLIAFSSKHERGRKFYTITPLGKDILRVTEINHVFYRIARWFKMKGDIYSKFLMADVNDTTDSPIVDLVPENFLALAKALFDPSSELNRIGSSYKWMNSFVWLTKNSRNFYEQFYTPEVLDWIKNAPYAPAKRFLPILAKAQKKWAKI